MNEFISKDSPVSELKIAIIGSGPAGFFCADYLLRLAQPCQVHLFERWPVPYGSVRYAIAPDRQRIRAVTAAFDRTASHSAFQFFGNVCIGRDLSLEELRKHYHAVIVATGADQPRKLQIPGEEKEGLLAVQQFAGWYNGRLDQAALSPELNQPAAVVIGGGNAALDALRILCLSPEALQKTEIPEPVQMLLAENRVETLHLLVRRGPLDVRFSLEEFESLCSLPGVAIELHPADCLMTALPSTAEEEGLLKLYQKLSTPEYIRKRIHFHFHTRPLEFCGDGKIRSVKIDSGGEVKELPGRLVISAIGQKATPVIGLSLDPAQGVIPHESGRVLQNGAVVPGLYTAGWAKRSGVGVIGRNKPDCRETVQAIMDDRAHLQVMKAGLPPLPKSVIDLEAWQEIDKAERLRSPRPEKTRESFLSLQKMLQAARLE